MSLTAAKGRVADPPTHGPLIKYDGSTVTINPHSTLDQIAAYGAAILSEERRDKVKHRSHLGAYLDAFSLQRGDMAALLDLLFPDNHNQQAAAREAAAVVRAWRRINITPVASGLCWTALLTLKSPEFTDAERLEYSYAHVKPKTDVLKNLRNQRQQSNPNAHAPLKPRARLLQLLDDISHQFPAGEEEQWELELIHQTSQRVRYLAIAYNR